MLSVCAYAYHKYGPCVPLGAKEEHMVKLAISKEEVSFLLSKDTSPCLMGCELRVAAGHAFSFWSSFFALHVVVECRGSFLLGGNWSCEA